VVGVDVRDEGVEHRAASATTLSCRRTSGENTSSDSDGNCSATAMASATGWMIHQCLVGRVGSCFRLVAVMAGVP
jgi:hypothetical protein